MVFGIHGRVISAYMSWRHAVVACESAARGGGSNIVFVPPGDMTAEGARRILEERGVDCWGLRVQTQPPMPEFAITVAPKHERFARWLLKKNRATVTR